MNDVGLIKQRIIDLDCRHAKAIWTKIPTPSDVAGIYRARIETIMEGNCWYGCDSERPISAKSLLWSTIQANASMMYSDIGYDNSFKIQIPNYVLPPTNIPVQTPTEAGPMI